MWIFVLYLCYVLHVSSLGSEPGFSSSTSTSLSVTSIKPTNGQFPQPTNGQFPQPTNGQYSQSSFSFSPTIYPTAQPIPFNGRQNSPLSPHCPSCSSMSLEVPISPELLFGLNPAYAHLPNVSVIYLPLNLTNILEVSTFCKNRPSGSYCYFPPNSTNCWSGTIVDCPSGLFSSCKAGYMCMVKSTSGFSNAMGNAQIPQVTAASCIAAPPKAIIPIKGGSPILPINSLITMCSNPSEAPTTSTRIINCLYYTSKRRPTPTVSSTFSQGITNSITNTLPSFGLTSHIDT